MTAAEALQAAQAVLVQAQAAAQSGDVSTAGALGQIAAAYALMALAIESGAPPPTTQSQPAPATPDTG